jgi:hypothetical protein
MRSICAGAILAATVSCTIAMAGIEGAEDEAIVRNLSPQQVEAFKAGSEENPSRRP